MFVSFLWQRLGRDRVQGNVAEMVYSMRIATFLLKER